jgi:hypothetical protein
MAFAFQSVLDDVRRLHSWYLERQQHWHDKLWVKEEQWAKFYKLRCLHCPCTKCKGHFLYIITNVREHFIYNVRDPRFKVWRGWSSNVLLNKEHKRRILGFQQDSSPRSLILLLICIVA